MTALMTAASWRKRAACRGVDPEVFYPVTDEEAGVAKAICASCPVREACLEYALSAREREGIWGGATERERRRILRQRRKSALKPPGRQFASAGGAAYPESESRHR